MLNYTNRLLACSMFASAATLMLATPADAQTEPQAADKKHLDTVLVTARKREESIQDVPVAVTALSAESIRENNIVTPYDVPLQTPGLTIRTANANRNDPDFFIRGQGSTFGSQAGVALYFAEAPVQAYTTAIGSNVQFYDLESIQVLKGPQGTLFGRSTTGGAVLLGPKKPGNEFEGFVEARLGNLGLREFTGAVNVPLVEDVLNVRLAGNIVKRDGYTTSLTTGQDLDDRDRSSWRLGVLLTPTDNIESYTLYYGADVDETATGSVLLAFNPNVAQFAFAGPSVAGFCGLIGQAGDPNCIGPRTDRLNSLAAALAAEEARVDQTGDIRHTHTSYINRTSGKVETLLNNTSFDIGNFSFLGDVTLKNVFATTKLTKGGSIREIGGAALPHAIPINGYDLVNNVPTLQDSFGSNDFLDRYSEEFQILGDAENWNWILGYFKEVDKTTPGVSPIFPTFNNAFTIPLDTLTTLSGLNLNKDDSDVGYFAQATVELDFLLEDLSMTVGYRLSESKRYNETWTATPTATGLVPGVMQLSRSLDQDSESYNIGLDYQATPDLLVYVATRTGFKPGGNNSIALPLPPGARLTFDPETVRDVELGFKYAWDAGPVAAITNVAIYNQDYKDIQRNEILTNPLPPFGTITQVNNIAAATIRGLELESAFNVGDRWTFNVNYAYVDAKYDEYPGSIADINGVVRNLIDSQFVGTPEHQATFGAKYVAWRDGDSEIVLSGDYYYQSEVYLDDQGIRDPANNGLQASWDNVNLRADWNNIGGHPADLSFWVRNATEDVHIVGVSSLVNNLGVITGIYNEPRTFGMDLRYRFGASGR